MDLGTQYHLTRYAFLFESIVLSDGSTLVPTTDDSRSTQSFPSIISLNTYTSRRPEGDHRDDRQPRRLPEVHECLSASQGDSSQEEAKPFGRSGTSVLVSTLSQYHSIDCNRSRLSAYLGDLIMLRRTLLPMVYMACKIRANLPSPWISQCK